MANWLYGCHPYHNYSFVAVVVAARPKQVFYGNNRADFSAIPGNVAPGLLFRKPDHFENYDDWPFLWGQNEGTIAGNTQYVNFSSSLKNIVAPKEQVMKIREKIHTSFTWQLTLWVTGFVLVISGVDIFLLARFSQDSIHQAPLDTTQQALENTALRVNNMLTQADFIHYMYHEIRTPLNIISGFAQVLTASRHSLESDEVEDIMARMQESANDIRRLTRQLEQTANQQQVIT